MAHKRLFANQKTQTQTCHCHSTSWTKARDLHFKKDLPKKRQVSNSLYPNSKGRKTHKAHKELDGVQHLPFSTIKAGWGAKHCSPLCWGRQSSPVLQGCAIQMFISTSNATKTGRRDTLFLAVLKIQKKKVGESCNKTRLNNSTAVRAQHPVLTMSLFRFMCTHTVCEISVTQLSGRYLYSSCPQILLLAPRKAINLLYGICFNLIVQGRMFR